MKAINKKMRVWLGVASAVIALLMLWGGGWLGPSQTHIVQASSAFEVTDPAQVAGFVDYVFEAEVVEELDRLGDTTLFRVKVRDNLLGSVPDTVIVSQQGFSFGNREWQFAEQPRLKVGQSYLVAASAPDQKDAEHAAEALIVVGGPWGAIVTSAGSLSRMEKAIQERVFPDDLSASFEASKRTRRRAWEIARPEYGE